jgi:hypothetical protein
MKFVTIIPVFLSFASLLSSAISAQEVHQKEDQMDRADPYVITNRDFDTGKTSQEFAEIRTFLWDHWRQHRCGRLSERSYSKEGEPIDTVFVIEPDQDGRWTIRITSTRPQTKGASPEYSRRKYTAYEVRRLGLHKAGSLEGKFIPEEEVLGGDTYRLVFYDIQGKETGGG